MSGDVTSGSAAETIRQLDPQSAFPDPDSETVTYEPSFEELRRFSEPLETTTEYDSPAYVSEFRSRSADRTKNAIDDSFTEEDHRLVAQALDHADSADLVCLDRMVGRHPEHAYCCRLFVPKEYGRIALAWAKLLDPAPEGTTPDFYTLQLPDWEETAIRVLPAEGVTIALGSDYTGEAKKSFLRLFMYRAKERGGLGLHAGSKRLTLESDDGVSDVYQAFLGLSGTGKSTLTGHGCWLESPESAVMLQELRVDP